MFYFVYCINCVLNDANGVCYCTCTLVAPLVPEICFWPANTRNDSNFMRCIHVFDLVLKFCSDLYEGIGIQLLCYFVMLVRVVALFIRLSFFSSVGQIFGLKFSRFAKLQIRLQLDAKTDLITNGMIFGFFQEHASFIGRHFCLD